MSRPTREEVDEILEYATPDKFFGDISTLAAEVRALRAELAQLRQIGQLDPAANAGLFGHKLTELNEPSGPDWPFTRIADMGDFMNGVNALVKAARAAHDGYRDTLESEWGPIEDGRWPKELTELDAALKAVAAHFGAVDALVKAARAVPENMAILRLSDRDKEVSDLLYEIHKALEPFDGE